MLGINSVEQVLSFLRFRGIFHCIGNSLDVRSIVDGEKQRSIQFPHHFLVIFPGHHEGNALCADEGSDLFLVHLPVVRGLPFVESLENDNAIHLSILSDRGIGDVTERIVHVLSNGLQGRNVVLPDGSDDNSITFLFETLDLFRSLQFSQNGPNLLHDPRHNGVRTTTAVVFLGFSVFKPDQGRITANFIFLGNFTLLGGIHFRQDDIFTLQFQ
mmetsp:Transcript_6746/g.13395  ORF Transcript_6746/g.13395 Transcript_6746/m.13395 type:complete len:214 (+) Transcript_6746:748-1389(+)